MNILDDTRAQSIGIARFFLSLIAGTFVVIVVYSITNPLFDKARPRSSGTDAAEATTWLQTGVDYLPITILFIAFFGLIALSIFQREVRS